MVGFGFNFFFAGQRTFSVGEILQTVLITVKLTWGPDPMRGGSSAAGPLNIKIQIFLIFSVRASILKGRYTGVLLWSIALCGKLSIQKLFASHT